jgi:hypothetical protein
MGLHIVEKDKHDFFSARIKNLNIGYVPYTEDFSHPADRRRFAYYAKIRNIKFEIANPSKSYDFVVVTQGADLSIWLRYTKGKIIFELIDSYLSIPKYEFRSLFRGLFKYLFGQNKYLSLSYNSLLKIMCKNSHVVICSTIEQKAIILPLCPNVHVILDFHGMLSGNVKNNYEIDDVINVIWEGQAQNISTIETIIPAIDFLSKKYKFVFHLVTDLDYPIAMGKFGKRLTNELARKIFGKNRFYLYEWNEFALKHIALSCDIAIIPVPINIPIHFAKPENRLRIFWNFGLPTLVSSTPAHTLVMSKSGIFLDCHDNSDWILKFEQIISNIDLRKKVGILGSKYVQDNYNDKLLLEKWDALFND